MNALPSLPHGQRKIRCFTAFVNPDGDFTYEAVTNIEGHDYNNGLIYAFKDTDGSMVPVKVFNEYEYIPGRRVESKKGT